MTEPAGTGTVAGKTQTAGGHDMLNRLTVAVIACVVLPAASLATEIPPELAQAVKDFDHAQVEGNRAELERLLADDYTLISGSGQVQTKAELIADYTTPGYKIEPFVILEPVEKVWSDGAVMGGLVNLKGISGGKPFAVTLRFVDVWARRNGKWQVIYAHVSRLQRS
jgi:hypothetical protein